MQKMFNYSYSNAGYINSMPFIILAIFGPAAGYIADKTGKRLTLFTISLAFLSTAYMLFIFFHHFHITGAYVVIPWIFFSIFYIFSATTVWPLLVIVVPYEKLGLGLGVVCSLINIGYLTIPPICGLIYDYMEENKIGPGYEGILIFLSIFIIICFLVSNKLAHLDTHTKDKLETKLEIQ